MKIKQIIKTSLFSIVFLLSIIAIFIAVYFLSGDFGKITRLYFTGNPVISKVRITEIIDSVGGDFVLMDAIATGGYSIIKIEGHTKAYKIGGNKHKVGDKVDFCFSNSLNDGYIGSNYIDLLSNCDTYYPLIIFFIGLLILIFIIKIIALIFSEISYRLKSKSSN
ncbi:hypothetical protein JXJ21_05165 [candidate division KSB1 bacterium]|nr:hypothetical protein [candidate division KSB1 bacterium]